MTESHTTWTPTPHPVLRVPTREQARAMGRDRLLEFLEKREELIRLEAEDPFRHGYRPRPWAIADRLLEEADELLILGGNRSSKSTYAGDRLVRALVAKPDARVWAFQTTEGNSKSMQQPIVHAHLPAEWRNLGKRGTVTNVCFTQKNGFSENSFVLPNGSQCWFRNYAQDPATIEGGEVDLVWCDELVPVHFLETIRYRLVTRKGKLIVTFTPIEGYSPTVKGYLSGARDVETAEAELLPLAKRDEADEQRYERVPLVQRPVRENARIVYFHSHENPWGGYDRLVKDLGGATRKEILCRAYGVPTKAIANRFPKFSRETHVISRELVPKTGVTDYLVVDPCSGRNWFMTWIRVDVKGRYFVTMEWPCQSRYIEGIGLPGPWTEASGRKSDGDRGPAQRPFGFGLARYRDEILRVEKDIELNVEERWMDSRYGNAATISHDRSTTLIEECASLDMDFRPAPGEHIDEGVDLVNDLLDFDRERPIDQTTGNEPHLYVCAECENTIYSLLEWTGQDGAHGACKDPIDNLRYAALARLEHVEAGSLRPTMGGAY